MRINYYAKSTISRVLLIGLILFVGIFLFGVSCQKPAPPPSPAPVPTPAPEPSPTPTTIEVDISDFTFVPGTITIPVGTTIIWTNHDAASHTTSSRNAIFESGSMSRDASFSHTFEQSGTFEYYCKFHPYMTAKIIVE